jgi:hypothetical protein
VDIISSHRLVIFSLRRSLNRRTNVRSAYKKNSSRVYQLDCWWDDQFTQSECPAVQIKSLYGGDAMKISRAYRDFQISLPPILSIFLTDTLLLM